MQERKLEMTVSEGAYEQLKSLKEKWGYKTIAELFSDSVGLSSFIKEQADEGYEVILRNRRTGKEAKVKGI